MQIIVGLLPPDAGTVERPARLGYCPQMPLLWDKLTVAEHFELFAEAYALNGESAARSRERLLEQLLSPNTWTTAWRTCRAVLARS